jgi:tRNA(Ile2) C34 agmatinyltransferase TiaS
MNYFYVICNSCNEDYIARGREPKHCKYCGNRKAKVYRDDEFYHCMKCGAFAVFPNNTNHICKKEDLEKYGKIWDEIWELAEGIDDDNIK